MRLIHLATLDVKYPLSLQNKKQFVIITPVYCWQHNFSLRVHSAGTVRKTYRNISIYTESAVLSQLI